MLGNTVTGETGRRRRRSRALAPGVGTGRIESVRAISASYSHARPYSQEGWLGGWVGVRAGVHPRDLGVIL
jgi:hypothetical protein